MGMRSQINLGLRVIITAIMLILADLAGSARCQGADFSLLIQQVPPEGGDVTPRPGVYHFKPDTEVVLTANPKPGYKFICWMGGVSNPAERSTATCINRPKIIIAVFERTEYGTLFAQSGAGGGGGGGDSVGYAPTAENYMQLMASGPGKMSGKPIIFQPVDIEKLLPHEPDEPVVPEPATAILLGLGGFFTFIRRRVSRYTR